MSDQMQEIQEDLIEYFKDMDNNTFVEVIDLLVYHTGTSNVEISKLADKFLTDNGLKEAYMNHVMELNNPSQFFPKHPTDIKMIEDINKSLLSLSYNRFRQELSNPRPTKLKTKTYSTPLVSKLNRSEKDDLIMVIENCERENNNYVDDEEITRNLFDEDEANDIIAERKRLQKLYPKVLKIIK